MQNQQTNNLDQANHRLCLANAELKYMIICFGDHLAKREGYKAHSGIDAVHFYLVKAYGWLPSVVKGISDDDLQFLLREEMQCWKAPKDALSK